MKKIIAIGLATLLLIEGCCSKCGNCGSGDKPIVSPAEVNTNNVNGVGEPVLPALVPWWLEENK